ncbi:MAG TPA: chemotaxis response regulator protein-glutamate methylesterase [Gemmatimonadaceae bacterium]|nr:chemotaxis response regulator protein-glutamate methylesterase [Gemmatimonadaceae bacterium]
MINDTRSSVLVVDDSAFMRRSIGEILAASEEFVVVGTARNGVDAIEKVRALDPDIVTLDVEMPELDGLQALVRIMKDAPRPVVMLSGATTPRGHDLTLRALELGAMDFVRKPSGPISMNLASVGGRLLEALRAARAVNLRGLAPGAGAATPAVGIEVARPRPAARPSAGVATRMVGIAASTGGPRALAEIVPALPRDMDAAVLIVQHMPSGFTRSLAQRLDSLGPLPVAEARDGEIILAGRVYLAPGGHHMRVRGEAGVPVIAIGDDPPIWGVRPAADVLFRSMAQQFGRACVGVVLTGMGRDGADGLRAVRDAGGRAVVQDRESSIIYGMPHAALQHAGADRVASLNQMADAIAAQVLFPHG